MMQMMNPSQPSMMMNGMGSQFAPQGMGGGRCSYSKCQYCGNMTPVNAETTAPFSSNASNPGSCFNCGQSMMGARAMGSNYASPFASNFGKGGAGGGGAFEDYPLKFAQNYYNIPSWGGGSYPGGGDFFPNMSNNNNRSLSAQPTFGASAPGYYTSLWNGAYQQKPAGFYNPQGYGAYPPMSAGNFYAGAGGAGDIMGGGQGGLDIWSSNNASPFGGGLGGMTSPGGLFSSSLGMDDGKNDSGNLRESLRQLREIVNDLKGTTIDFERATENKLRDAYELHERFSTNARGGGSGRINEPKIAALASANGRKKSVTIDQRTPSTRLVGKKSSEAAFKLMSADEVSEASLSEISVTESSLGGSGSETSLTATATSVDEDTDAPATPSETEGASESATGDETDKGSEKTKSKKSKKKKKGGEDGASKKSKKGASKKKGKKDKSKKGKKDKKKKGGSKKSKKGGSKKKKGGGKSKKGGKGKKKK